MGRAPCCDKANVKKGPWSPEEDAKLKSYIDQHGTGGNWIALPQKIGLKRCGKSCRLRWLNYLRPNIKHGDFSEEEDNIICNLYISIGSRWSIIAAQLPGRTDNDIKNYWNTKLKKKLLGNNHKQRKSNNINTNNNNNQQQRGNVLVNSMETMINNNVVNNSTIDNQNLYSYHYYWPELPVLAQPAFSTEQQPRSNDHESIRKLLIKLGGRFSDHDQLRATDHSTSQQQLYHDHELVSAQNNLPSTFGPEAIIEETRVFDDNPGIVLNGSEFFYDNSIISGANVRDHDQDIGWGEISSLVYNNNNNYSINVPIISVASDYVEREIFSDQDCIFSELKAQ